MAASGSFHTSGYDGRYLTFEWEETSQSIANNSTTISWTLKGGGTAPASYYYTRNIKLTIDGETVYTFGGGSGSYITLYNGTTVASGTYTFTHKADGTRTFEAYAEAGIYVWAVNCTGSKTFTLDTIARASVPTVSASSVQMKKNVTISTNRASSSFTHTLTYAFGGSTGTIATGVGASYVWTVPDLVSKISGKTSGSCTITCKTYSGSTLVGTKTVSLTLTIPAKSVPSVSAGSVQMGKSVTIYTKRESVGYTHTIAYSIGSKSGTIGTTVGASIAWTPPKSLASYTGDETSGDCTITCKTYSGPLLVGTSTIHLTLTVPDATVPTLSASAMVMGMQITITMAEEAAVFTHALKYELKAYGGATVLASGDIVNHAGGSYAWTVPLSLAAKIPSATKATVTVICKTYIGENLVGTESVDFTAVVPNGSATQPKVAMTLTPVSDLPSAFSGLYVQGKSKVKVAYSASSSYSTIESYETTVNGGTGSTNPYTSNLLTATGDMTITGKVTDARGFSTTKTGSIEVIPYARPRIIPGDGNSSIVCKRCNSDGKADPGGVYLLVRIGRKYSPVESGGVQKNRCRLSYQWKRDGDDDDSYSEAVELLAGDAQSDYVSAVLPGIASSNTTAYTVRLIAEDDIGERDSVAVAVPTAFVTFHSPEGGHGFTLGGYHDPSKYNVFDCFFDAEFEGDVYGKVIGLGKLPEIPEGANFNDYKEFGVWAVHYNDRAVTMVNCPSDKAGTLRVWSATGTGNTTANYQYIIQEYIPYNNYCTFRRHMHLGSGSWEYGQWKVTDGIDAVVEQGETDGWYWMKYANGVAECWRRVSQTIDITTQWGSFYYGTPQVVYFPFEFAYVPVCNISTEYQAAGNPSCFVASNGRTTTTQAANILLARPTEKTGVDCVVVYHAIGRWKE